MNMASDIPEDEKKPAAIPHEEKKVAADIPKDERQLAATIPQEKMKMAADQTVLQPDTLEEQMTKFLATQICFERSTPKHNNIFRFYHILLLLIF
jgi:hypothetical protein